MTPAEELREAAKLLRERAGAVDVPAWRGRPWAVTQCSDKAAGECPCIVYQGEYKYKPFGEPQVPPIQYVADAETPGHAAFIATMHPPVGIALADWLEAEAASAEAYESHGNILLDASMHALKVARAILGTGEAGHG